MRKFFFLLCILGVYNQTIAQPFYSGFTSYTPDGLFSANAQPVRFITPSGAQLRIGYQDHGSGQYMPRIGLIQESTHVTAAQNSFGNAVDGSFTFNVGAVNEERLRIMPSGRIGIGTVAPEDNLTVLMDPSTNGAGIAIKAVNSGGAGSQPGFSFLSPSGSKRMYSYLDVSSDTYNLGNAVGAPLLTVNQSGSVGIGTNTPAHKFQVSGTHPSDWNGLFTGPNGQAVYMSHGGGYGMHINAGTNSNASNYVFEAYSNSQPRFYVRGDGNVGVGTNAPGYKFVVSGTHPGDWNSLVTGPNEQAVYMAHGGGYGMHVNAGNNASTSTYVFEAYSNGLPRLYVRGDGNVGIGTTQPDAKLAVKGKIHAEEVKVDLNVPGPDYVFEADYKLKSLEEVEKFVSENKHLPEIPSAKVMEKDGISMGDMQMKLLQKIEELTLYIIELNKKQEQQEAEIKKLKNKK